MDAVPDPNPCMLELGRRTVWSKPGNSLSWQQLHRTRPVDQWSEWPPTHGRVVFHSVATFLKPGDLHVTIHLSEIVGGLNS